MGADILMFNAHKVPVGRDQIQHIEMARDMANSFNHRYGEHFVAPQAEIEESVATLPGLDGRKMSKSYDNTIPLFASREQLKKLIASIVTDSRAPGEPKETEGSAIFQIYQAFADTPETEALRKAYSEGIAWGDAKQLLFERIDREIAPMRQRYQYLMEHPAEVENLLIAGAMKARAIATPFMRQLRSAVGLRSLGLARSASSGDDGNAGKDKVNKTKSTAAHFKQYREADGKFYFKMVSQSGDLLLQSLSFDAPKVAGHMIAMLQSQGAKGLPDALAVLEPIDAARLAVVSAALDALSQQE
jgi:tryptophanyl-tRNA synthetase